MNKHKVKTSLFVGGLLLIGLILIQLNLGAIRISPLETIQTLMGNGTARNQLILFEFRLPRIVMAMLVGMGLAISGAILQGITQNDLADSSILGINAGAGLGVVLYLFFSTGSTAKLGVPQFLFIPLVALAGAFFAASLIYLGAWKKGIHQLRLLLVGIAVTALLNAFILIFQLQMDEFNFEKAMVWLSGNLWNVNWSFILIIACWLAILLPLVYWFTMRLDILRLGDQIGQSLGLEVEKTKAILLFLAVALAGISVAGGGGIAFVGLLAPHIAKRLVGGRSQSYLPVSAVVGMILVLGADIVGKNLFAPNEVAVGLVVAIIATPYFIWLMMRTV